MIELWSKNKRKIITFLICGILFIGVLSVIALGSGAIMKLFGFEYESVGSMVLFFLAATIISYPLSLIAGALPKVLLAFDRISKQIAIILYLLLDTIATALGLCVVDYFMESVSATELSIIVVSLILALFGISDIDKKAAG